MKFKSQMELFDHRSICDKDFPFNCKRIDVMIGFEREVVTE